MRTPLLNMDLSLESQLFFDKTLAEAQQSVHNNPHPAAMGMLYATMPEGLIIIVASKKAVNIIGLDRDSDALANLPTAEDAARRVMEIGPEKFGQLHDDLLRKFDRLNGTN